MNKFAVLPLCSVIGSFLIQFTLGAAYSYSELSKYFTPPSINKTRLLFGFAMFGLSSSMGFGGYMEASVNPFIVIFVGSLIMNLGVVVTAFTCDSMWTSATYGLICGTGAGLIYAVSLSVTSKLFTRFNGLIFGIMVSGFSLGSFLISFISKHLRKEDPSEMFLYCSMMFLGIQMIGLTLIWVSHKYSKKENSSYQISNLAEDVIPVTNTLDVGDVAPHNMIVKLQFWIIWIIFGLNSFGTILIIQLHEILETMHELHSIPHFHLINNFSSFFGRIIWGALATFLPPKIVFMFLCFGSSIIYLAYAIIFPNSFAIMVSICCGWLSGNFSIVPLLVFNQFGPKYFATNFGIMWTSYSFAGILISISLTQMAQNLKYVMYMFFSMSILSFILTFIYKEDKPRHLFARSVN